VENFVTSWTEEQVLAQVRAFIEAEFLYMRPDVVLADHDSLMTKGVVEVMQFLADTFQVAPADDEITEANLGSLRAISRFVVQKLASG
jgi:hypothetical protein